MSEEIEIVKLTPLSIEEVNRLDTLEKIIQPHIDSFKVVGQALSEICESKLYRETHHTFEDYVQERWNFTSRRAYQLIEAHEVVQKCEQFVHIPNEGVARELAKLTDKQQVKVVKAIAMKTAKRGKSPVTAKVVKEVSASINHHKGGLYEQMMRAKELANTPLSKPPQDISNFPEVFKPNPSYTREVSGTWDVSPVAKVEACYQANKARWNNPPPPSPRSIIDTILQALQ